MIKDGIELAERINKEIEKVLPVFGNVSENLIKMDMETVYDSLLLFARKNYLGKILWTKGQYRTSYVWKGSAAIRTDVSQVVIDMYNYLGKSIVDGKDYDYRKKYLDKLTQKVLNYDFTLEEIATPTQLQKELDDYKVPQAHVKGAWYSNSHLGTSYKKGDKPMWAYVHSPPWYPDTEVISFTWDTNIPNGFRPDVKTVAKRLIQPTINRFLKLTGETYKIPIRAIEIPEDIQEMIDKKAFQEKLKEKKEARLKARSNPNKLLHYFG
jgi:DNA polymerase elongation subunit (family B)